MAAGLIPAGIVGLALTAALVAIAFGAPHLATAVTPFADSWDPIWSSLLRTVVGLAVVGGTVVLSVAVFTALTLVVGEPFYDRIWRSVERETGGAVPDHPYGIVSAARDAVSLFARGVLAALGAGAVGLVPFVGAPAAAVTGALLNGRVIADELASRGLTARGLDAPARAALVRGHRGRVLGFGVAVHVCFLVPFAAVVVMPAAVAGAALLARHLAGEADAG
ncbi:EI24 domain-containing protein [Microbacterium marinilacus]|nr:EI24 domain-containing protein [Microbacterium marinilacus]